MEKGFYLKMWVKGPLLSCGGGVGLNMPVLYEFTCPPNIPV